MIGGDILEGHNNRPIQGSVYDYAAYIPCYERGNSVRAVKKDGETALIEKSIKSVIAELLRESSISIKSIRKNFSQYTGMTNLMPIPLSLGRVLIPVKVRKTIGVNDGSYAYIDLLQIDDVFEDGSTKVKLKSGSTIDCMEVVKTIRERMKKGKVIEEKFTSRMMGEYGFKEGLSEISTEYEKAATKGDITMLAYEIIRLRDRMR